MFCSECGKEVSDESKFCNFCGREIQLKSIQNKELESKLENKIDMQELVKNAKYDKIQAIKDFRALTGLGLNESKEAVDSAFKNKELNSISSNNLISVSDKVYTIQKNQSVSISCPKCNSTQFHSSDKGFSAGKALAGGFATGGIGFLAGFIGSKKVVLTCLNCGHKWKV